MEDFFEKEKIRAKAKHQLYMALDIGEEMLISGAEISRVEDTIGRICRAFGAERVDVFSITSSIIVTMYADEYGPITQTRRINRFSTDMRKLNQLNQLSHEICDGTDTHIMEMETIQKELKEIKSLNQRTVDKYCLIFAMISASFALFFGGNSKDAFAAAIVGMYLGGIDRLLKSKDINQFLASFVLSFSGGFFAIFLVCCHLGDSVDKINIGNIMLLIPGIALTNSLRDIFSGDTISGILRFVESISRAMTLAFGFVLAYQIGGIIL